MSRLQVMSGDDVVSRRVSVHDSKGDELVGYIVLTQLTRCFSLS